ncbi:MAG: CoA transferase [Candidatus Dormibacteraeota bacterium]|nr:CoA transferase [Candidatus Dormibacteraeota bacterium]
MDLPLSDIRVIDLTVARAGPTCVRQLADWGADVVRVEPPAGTTAAGDVGGRRHGPDFQNLHRNKRSLTLDLRSPEGQEVLCRLLDRSDVLVENMRPPVKRRLGFDYETVRARNPRLIYGSISGFGQTGPYAERGGVDQIAQGMGGLMSVTGFPSTGPTRVGIPVADLAAGLYLAVGILVALHQRERTGEGQWVQTSLLEAMVAMMDFQAARWTIGGEVPPQEGNNHPTNVPMGCFQTADGHVNVAGAGGRLWERFCEAIGRPELVADPRFDTPDGRFRNREQLNALIAERLRARTSAEWVAVLNEVGVPAGPVYRVDEVFADPQVRHLRLTSPVTHPSLGSLDLVRNAVSSDRQVKTVRDPSPELGEHTSAVLGELGLTAAEIEDLRRRGVV